MKTINILLLSSLLLISLGARAEIPNFAKVDDNVYRGGRPTQSEDIVHLKSLGIKTVINLQGGDLRNVMIRKIIEKFEPGELPQNIANEGQWTQNAGLNFFNFPLDSIGEVSRQDDQSVTQILKIMVDPKFLPVFVHCEHGRDRTGMVISLYRVQTTPITIHQAHEEWESYGHEEINQLFTGGLDKYFYKKAMSLRSVGSPN